MKSKQLANVLIKILGLSVLAHGLPSIISAFVSVLQSRGIGLASRGEYYWWYPVSAALQLVIGIFCIIKSREISEFLFKDEVD